MNSLRYTFSSSGEIFSNSLSSFRTSWRNFRAMVRSYIVFFFVFLFSCWAISSSTSSFDTSINLDLESSSIGSRIFRFQWDKSSAILKLHQNYWQRRCWERHDLLTITMLIFLRVKITCYLHVWRYHVFARKLTWYFIGVYIIMFKVCYSFSSQLIVYSKCIGNTLVFNLFLSSWEPAWILTVLNL